jgi:hypothetical protein
MNLPKRQLPKNLEGLESAYSEFENKYVSTRKVSQQHFGEGKYS